MRRLISAALMSGLAVSFTVTAYLTASDHQQGPGAAANPVPTSGMPEFAVSEGATQRAVPGAVLRDLS